MPSARDKTFWSFPRVTWHKLMIGNVKMFRRTVITCLISWGVLIGNDAQAKDNTVLIGLTAEFGHNTSTSAQAIEMGMRLAVAEVNERGGVLGGRKIGLDVKDNRSIPALGVADLRAFAQDENVVAVVGGKFSPVMIDLAQEAEILRVPVFSPWAAADQIVSDHPEDSFVFRMSMRDSWALELMVNYAQAKGWRKLGLLLPNNSWGQSCKKAADAALLDAAGISIVAENRYNWGDVTLYDRYGAMVSAGADAVLLVANEGEGAQIIKAAGSHPDDVQIPIVAHLGITGGDLLSLTDGLAINVDLTVVQTFSFIGRSDDRARSVLESARKFLDIHSAEDIPSQVGFAHGYDLVHIVAKAIDLAGTTTREDVRDALEQVRNYDGLTKYFEQPFTVSSHEALMPKDVFLGRIQSNGSVVPISN